MTSNAKRAAAGGILAIVLFFNSFVKFMQNRRPANPYDVFQRDSAFFECAALLTLVIGSVLIWYRREMLQPEAKGDSFFKMLFACVFVVLLASLASYTYWKTDQYWVSSIACRCGDAAALFHTRQEYISMSVAKETAPLLALLISTVIHPALGGIVSAGVLLFAILSLVSIPAGGSESYTTFKQFFAMFEGLLSLLFLFFNIVPFALE